MPKEETIEMRHIRGVIGEKENLPSLNARSTLSSIIKSIMIKLYGVPHIIHLYGALNVNKTITLNAGEITIVSLFSDGTYLYAGLATSPGKIIKIDLSTYTRVGTITFAAGENSVNSLFSDGTYLYAGVETNPNPGKIIKIDLASFTVIDTLTFAAGEFSIRTLFSDGTYLYVGLGTTPGYIVRVSLETFTKIDTLTLSEINALSLFSDGTYLYTGIVTAGSIGKIIKINLSTFTEVSTLTIYLTETNSLFSDGTYLYVGLGGFTIDGKVVKLDLLTFTEVKSLTYAATTFENEIVSLYSDGTYLYAGLNFSPGKIKKIDISTFTDVSTITFAAGENSVNSLFSDGTYLYSGLATNPAKITRRYLIPYNDQHQRKIDITKESVQSTISATTSNGNVGGTTLIDTARTEGNDYWNNQTLLILGGSYKGQSRKISDFDAASDTITVSPAFNGQILSGVRYVILPYISSLLLDNLTGTVTNGTYSHANNTNEQDVLEFAAAKQKIDLFLDTSNITQSTTVREYIKVDGTTYRQLSQKVYPTNFDTDTKSISISIEQPNRLYKVTFKSGTAEGAAKDVPYSYIILPRT